jgi:predicted RecB family nuclease
MNLSKSRFVAGVQCLKRLYWQVYNPELAAEQQDSSEAIMRQGLEVGRLAQQAFPGGLQVEGSHDDLAQALRNTRELISNAGIPAIFEATFKHGNVLVRVDVLQRQPGNKWRLIEVKSTARVKDHHLYDVGIQKNVASACGVDLSHSCVMHLNRGYVYSGGAYDLDHLFTITDVDDGIAQLEAEIETQIRTEFHILEQPAPPEVAPGGQCRNQVVCEFFHCCNSPTPADHVSHLPGIRDWAVQELASLGIESIHGIPNDFPLSGRLRRACTSVQRGTPWFSSHIARKLEELRFPLCFMDFETVNPAIPRYAGMRPFDQIPFQWSLHVRRNRGASLDHFEFLETTDSDPRRQFLGQLCPLLEEAGSIVVYGQTFESQRLADLARWFPEFVPRVQQIQRRLWDLLPVVRNNVYHPDFQGSFSLKDVLPALVPELSYEDMEVAEGISAGRVWESIVRGNLDVAERIRLKDALLAYCRQDTLAMARLIEKLGESAVGNA